MTKKLLLLAMGSVLALGLAGMGVADDLALVAGESGMDADGNGEVSEAEYVAYVVTQARAEFRRLDRDGNGTLSAGETAPERTGGRAFGKPGFLRDTLAGDGGQNEAFRKRVSAGPSMRQGGR